MHEPSRRADDLAREVVDAAVAVHRSLGPGYAESVYENALCLELAERNVPFERQAAVEVRYRDTVVGAHRLDLVVDATLVVELKAVDALNPVHVAQVLSYLRSTRLELGLLINFQVHLLRNGIRRVVATTHL
jgi:GxxExxY protein